MCRIWAKTLHADSTSPCESATTSISIFEASSLATGLNNAAANHGAKLSFNIFCEVV